MFAFEKDDQQSLTSTHLDYQSDSLEVLEDELQTAGAKLDENEDLQQLAK